jgi:hypothetical protein
MKIEQLKEGNIVTTKEIQKGYQDAFIDLDERFFDYFVLRDVVTSMKEFVKSPDKQYILDLIDHYFPVFKENHSKKG